MDVRELAAIIKRMSIRDLTELNRLLRDLPGWGGAGVREPRRPLPESPGDSIVVTPENVTETESLT